MLLDEVPTDFPHVARAHRYDQVTLARDAAEVFDDLIELRQVQRLVPVRLDPPDQVAAAHEVPLGFAVADEVDVRDDRQIRGGEAGGEVLEEKARATVLMR